MYGVSLKKCLEKDPFTKISFMGVFARDELPTKVTFPSWFIVNTAKRLDTGKHWLAFHYDKNGYCVFFDSYGLPPSHFDLESFLDNTTSSWTWNKMRIQGNSSYCGYYCILFLIFICRDKSLKFFSQFSSNYQINDRIIRDLIEKNS